MQLHYRGPLSQFGAFCACSGKCQSTKHAMIAIDLKLQWNLIKRSVITKPSYNVILMVLALYISLFLYPSNNKKPDITK